MRIPILTMLLGLSALAAGPADDYIGAQLRVVRGLEAQVPALTRVADEAARELLAGGRLYLAGERGMVSELLGRAGGLCGAKRFAGGKTLLAEHDVVLLSDYGPRQGHPATPWEVTGGTRALRILFVSKQHAVFDKPLVRKGRIVGVDIPRDGCIVRSPEGEAACPATAPAIAIAQWAFTAELIGACRRNGRQLAVYLSIHLDQGRRRYQRTKGLLFEPGLKPKPPEPGEYAKAFLGHARQALEAIRRDELSRIRKAAAWIREASAGRRKVVRHMHAHLPPHEVGVPGDPGCFTHSPRLPLGDKAIAWMRQNLAKGDIHLLVGYQQNQDAMAAAANALGARTIFITSLPPSREQAANPLHLYVNPHWPLTDACLELPGYDVKACPLSAICGLTCYYAIAAEVVAGE